MKSNDTSQNSASAAERLFLSQNALPPGAMADLAEGRAKLIPLTRGRYAVVDAEMFEELNKFKWQFSGTDYAVRTLYVPHGKHRKIYMHRVILDTAPGQDTDHIDGNGLNNLRSNLRVCTTSQNMCNMKARCDNRLGIKGVSKGTKKRRFNAAIKYAGTRYHLGYFDTAAEAGAAYTKAATALHGNFAWREPLP